VGGGRGGGLAGDPAGPGYRRIIIRPQVVGGLKGARVRYESPYGRTGSAWERDGETLRLEVAVPAKTTATVYVPAAAGALVMEGDTQAAAAMGVKFRRRDSAAAVYEAARGRIESRPRGDGRW